MSSKITDGNKVDSELVITVLYTVENSNVVYKTVYVDHAGEQYRFFTIKGKNYVLVHTCPQVYWRYFDDDWECNGCGEFYNNVPITDETDGYSSSDDFTYVTEDTRRRK